MPGPYRYGQDMAVSPNQIGWSSYGGYEGPFFRGVVSFQEPGQPDFLDKCLATVTATEGGHYDAVNMYDSCVVSVGLIQQCLAVHELDRMLGGCAAADVADMRQRFSKLPVPADFRPNNMGQWRFVFLDGRGAVETKDQMRAMFLGGSTGLKGQFSPDQRECALECAAALASMWDNPTLVQAQHDYAKSHVTGYVMPRTKSALWADPSEDGWKGALKAAVVSYSANLPAVADKFVQQAVASPDWDGASDEDRFTMAMKRVVYGPGIAIWPNRYRAIGPVISRLFGVSLPSLDDLKGAADPQPQDPPAHPTWGPLDTVQDIQRLLIHLGYDLGPAGADGVFGPKTRTAMMGFQRANGLQPDGVVGPLTHAALIKAAG